MADSRSANPIDQTDSREGGDATSRKSGIVEKVRDTAASQLTNQKNRATDGLGSVAEAVRQTTQQLKDQNHDVIARYTEQAAHQIDRLNQRIREKDIDELMSDAQRLARRQPALFIGGAFALGLIGARFFKSSARANEDDYRRYQGTDGARRGAYGGTASGGEYRGYKSAAGTSAYGGSAPSRVHDYQSSPTLNEEIGAPSTSSSSGTSDSAGAAGGSVPGDAGGSTTGRVGGASSSGSRSRRGTQSERS
jgi:hypothetical protein